MTKIFELIIIVLLLQHDDSGTVSSPGGPDQGLPGGGGELVAMLPGVYQLCPGSTGLLCSISSGVLEHQQGILFLILSSTVGQQFPGNF